MEDKLGLSTILRQQRKETKKNKNPKSPKPVKVVYISNPMKFNVSASDFRALVQECTGQTAEFPYTSKFPATGEDFSCYGKVEFLEVKRGCDDYSPDPVAAGDPVHDVPESSPTQDELFDDVFNSDQMIEELSGVWPSDLLFESSPVDVLTSH